MKHIVVRVDDVVLFDGDVDGIEWHDNSGGVKLVGSYAKPGRPSSGGLLNSLMAARNGEDQP